MNNPAPVMRLVQALGDKVFNQSTAFNKRWDDSALGVAYHDVFGGPNYEVPTHGSNGTFNGVLNRMSRSGICTTAHRYPVSGAS